MMSLPSAVLARFASECSTVAGVSAATFARAPVTSSDVEFARDASSRWP